MKIPNLEQQSHRQKEIIAFLVKKAALWDTETSDESTVEIVETHGATVLLGAAIALKMKKPVHFDHMDYSSLEKRQHFCHRELSFNKRSAPDLYLDVCPLKIDKDAGFTFDGPGEIVEYFLKMKRFPKGSRLDEVAKDRGLTVVLQDDLTDAVLTFHQQATILWEPENVPDFHTIIDANFRQLDTFCPDILTLTDVQAYRATLHDQVTCFSSLLSRRIASGWVRWGHGDLHLQNICVLEGKPMLFDAIEYQDEFVISDILYDLSFLIMDLWEKNLRTPANRIFNRYLNGLGWTKDTEELPALKLLPFYLSLRSGIRTHVEGNRSKQSHDKKLHAQFSIKTGTLFKSACDYLLPKPPHLIAIGGFSGSGKSTLAANLAPYIGAAPGAVHIRSDVIRRQIMDWDEFSPMEQSAYTSDISQQVYEKMLEIAGAVLETGHSVVMDAVLDRDVDQRAIENLGMEAGVPFSGIWLTVRKATMASRIEHRQRDASDATVAVLESQLERNAKISHSWHQLDGNGTSEDCLALSLALLEIDQI